MFIFLDAIWSSWVFCEWKSYEFGNGQCCIYYYMILVMLVVFVKHFSILLYVWILFFNVLGCWYCRRQSFPWWSTERFDKYWRGVCIGQCHIWSLHYIGKEIEVEKKNTCYKLLFNIGQTFYTYMDHQFQGLFQSAGLQRL